MFKKASASAYEEYNQRKLMPKKIMSFGVDFLDDALRGILPDDLILLGAPSGAGKTQLCCNIAYANLLDGKKVHYIALEASQYEIERRLKYPLLAERYYADPNRIKLETKLNFTDWMIGAYGDQLSIYEDEVADYFHKAYDNLYLYYKDQIFNTETLIESVLYCSSDTDLILIDHVHYFDFDDTNENRAIKEIAKTVRTLAIDEQKPIILVAHLRKRDRGNEELVSGLDEFHGSSDLYKIATRVITIAPGGKSPDGNFETYFRIPKNRLDGGVTRFIAKEFYNPKKGSYERSKYQIGSSNQNRKTGFSSIEQTDFPEWARRADRSSVNPSINQRKWSPYESKGNESDS